jgi:hypothetical protein
MRLRRGAHAVDVGEHHCPLVGPEAAVHHPRCHAQFEQLPASDEAMLCRGERVGETSEFDVSCSHALSVCLGGGESESAVGSIWCGLTTLW